MLPSVSCAPTTSRHLGLDAWGGVAGQGEQPCVGDCAGVNAEGTGGLDLLVFSEGSQLGKMTPGLCTWQNSTEVSCLPEARNNHTTLELGSSL